MFPSGDTAYEKALGSFLDLVNPNKQEERERSLIRMAAEDPIAWMETHFYIPERNGPLKLYPHQRAVLREAYRVDPDTGHFKYDIVVWSDIKKSAKSTIAAAVALHRAVMTKWGSIKIVANDLKQADSRVAFYLRRAIEMNRAFEEVRQVRYRTVLPNRTTIEAVPIDPSGEAGGNDDLIIFSELWAAKHTAIKKMWAEMTLSPTKHGRSQRWIETYAGYSGEAPILENLYEQGVREGEKLDLSFEEDGEHYDLSDLEVYANGPLLCMWNDRPRLPWQTPEYYEQEKITQTDTEFRRLHKNEWVSSMEAFIEEEWWRACEVPGLGPPNDREQVVIALDAAVSGDCFGLVVVTVRHEERKITKVEGRRVSTEVLEVPIVQARYCRKWVPPKGGSITYSNPHDPNDPTTPEGVLRRLIARLNVLVVCYDEYQLHDFCSRLRQEGLAYFRKFPQGQDRLVADKQLQDSIKERTLEHGGDPDLTEHMFNANAKSDGQNKLRIVKRTEKQPIDLAVCLSMANAIAQRFLR